MNPAIIRISIGTSFIFCIVAAVAVQQDPKDLIKGEWTGVKPEGITWKFTDSKLIKNNDLEYSYALSKDVTKSQCKGSGYDAVYNSNQLVLIQIHEKFKICYIVDTLTEARLVLFSEPSGQYFSFKRKR